MCTECALNIWCVSTQRHCREKTCAGDIWKWRCVYGCLYANTRKGCSFGQYVAMAFVFHEFWRSCFSLNSPWVFQAIVCSPGPCALTCQQKDSNIECLKVKAVELTHCCGVLGVNVAWWNCNIPENSWISKVRFVLPRYESEGLSHQGLLVQRHSWWSEGTARIMEICL